MRKTVTALGIGFLLTLPLYAAPTEILKEGNITVSYEKTGDASQIDTFRRKILPEVKKIYTELAAELGVSAQSPEAKIFFYSPATFHKIFPHTIDTRIPAFFDGRAVQARADNDVNHALKRTLRHEMTHLLVAKKYRKVPAWLNEGLAEYQERKITVDPIPNNIDYNTIYIAHQNGNFLELHKLEGQMVFNRGHGTVVSGLAYTMAYVAVYELQQKVGMSGILRYLEAVSQDKDPQREFQAHFGMTYEKFNTYLVDVAKRKS